MSRLIDADALAVQIRDNVFHDFTDEFWGVMQCIREQPTIEPERKTGEWIPNSPVTMKCDQCGFVIKDWDWHRFNFCPNCGGYNGFDGRPEWRPLIDVSSNDQK